MKRIHKLPRKTNLAKSARMARRTRAGKEATLCLRKRFVNKYESKVEVCKLCLVVDVNTHLVV